ncbi:MAG: hypothetical protein ACR2JC_00645 [Chloroflexota bacterium]|nr:MAG: hypothetical protein DLM70_16160 [Chloroflexota bacterium]
MAMLHLVYEENIHEDHLQEYFHDFYRVVCVGERPSTVGDTGGPVRSTYVVDWEQLVHLLEDYTVFGEDIVEVSGLSGDEALVLSSLSSGLRNLARA